MCNMETPDKNVTSALSTVLSNASQWYMPRKSLPENKTNSSSHVQQPGDFQQPSTSTPLVRVVAVEHTDTEKLDDLNEIFTPLQFEVVNENLESESYDDEFDEDYLSRLNGEE